MDPPVRALKGINFELQMGERVVVLGKSGSGKSTFLNIIGLLDQATTGTVEFLGNDTGALSRRELDQLRADSLGFVFQENHVLGHRTVIENLHVKLGVSSVPTAQWPHRIEQVLEQVGLGHRKHSHARLLSGGEKQRLAVARAIITSPKVVLADEPTGNLDDENASRVLDLFDTQAQLGSAIVIITHDPRMVARVDRALRLEDGRLVDLDSQEPQR
ncbi:ABC transporter ATP-binding protein [Jonesiaceae bacterium BS-20]|uniref:ABC transporter ATP-binding protein n=1 Tax=Jonesiaceae bacterium BS-20 TaxID=3120821 RepID=A0AAU7E1A7_9MICO